MRRTLRGAVAGTAVVSMSLLLAAPALASAHTTPKPDPYLVADTEMTTPASIAGGGSTFAAPLENAGEAYYQARNGNATLAGYQAVGSGAGEVGLLNLSFAWGGTDVPLAQSDIAADQPAGKNYNLAQFAQVPIGLGGVAIDYNLPGFKANFHLELNATILAGIYKGTITTWNNPQIANLNKAILKKAHKKLPSQPIKYVARADKSGTTYIFTNFLGTAAPTVWTTAPSKSPLTLGTGDLGGTGNPGVAAAIGGNPYSIGYVEYSYNLLNPGLKSGVAAILNASHKYVVPSPAGVAADAAKKPDVNPSSLADYSIVFEPGATSYPISGYTWAVVFKQQTSLTTGTLLVKYLDWLSHSFPTALHRIAGQNLAADQGYVALPSNIQRLARTTLLGVKGPGNVTLLTTTAI
jgi:phosphate transport system substrate-binding protein